MFTSTKTEDFEKLEVEDQNSVFEINEEQLIEKYQLNKCIEWINQNKFVKTCLQFPENLLCHSTSIALYLQKTLKTVVYILADTSYGSCCVDEVAAAHVDGDSIIHFGHACLSPVIKLPVFYVFEKKTLNVQKLMEGLEDLNHYSVVIFYEDAFYHLYSKLCNAFKEKKNICISRLNICQENLEIQENEKIVCGRIFSNNLHKNLSAVYIGNESITLTNLVMSLPGFMWYQYTEDEEFVEYYITRNKFLMKKNYLVEKVKDANVLGILVGTLGIKNFLEAIERVKTLAKIKGKKCYKLVVGKPNSAKLANFPEIDVFVYLACQENSLLHDFKGYYKPIVSLYEVEMALGNLPYSGSYSSDFREFLKGGVFYNEVTESQTNSSAFGAEVEVSQALLEKNPGTLIESPGSEFLMSRTWRGLEQNIEKKEVCKAIKGRTGVAQSYDNEMKTLSEKTRENV